MTTGLDPEAWKRVEALLDEALRVPREERASWLARLAAEDAAIHGHVAGLLAADASAESEGFLRDAAGLTLHDTETGGGGPVEPSLRGGERIGPYTLARELGRGGMGTVWLAERSDGAFKRAVALKLPYAGLDDRGGRERFDRERDILAELAHPNIARLYDAGVTAEGRPYLALEAVDGVPITAFAEANGIGVPERIRLFLPVLDAVQYAHRNLVVHRDLKPSNVLVTAGGTPMLLDFGIAKLLGAGGDATAASDATELGGSPMTPRYASPEQIEGGTITTSSDVYALGVMLYELLSGALPYRLKTGTRAEIQAAIAGGDTMPPSRAVPAGFPDRRRRVRELAGDLDGILLKAIDRAPGRRYASAEAFARDLEHFLAGEAVEARPNTRLYRLSKFTVRHRVGVGVAAAVTAAVLGSLAFALFEMRAAERQRDRAEHVSSFLTSLFKVVDPNETNGKTVTAREILDKGTAKIGELEGEPLVQADLLITMGTIYQHLGLYDSALPLLEKSLDLRRRLVGSDDSETMESINDLATLLQNQGKLDQAEALFREALERRRRVLGPLAGDTLNAENNLALVLQARGKLAEAEPLFRTSLGGKRQTERADDPDLLPPINNLAMLLKAEGKLAEAKPLLAELVEKARRVLGDDDPHTLVAVSNLGLLLLAEGRPAEAETYLRDALDRRRRILGADHPQTLYSTGFVGDCLRSEGRLAESRGYTTQALDGLRRVLGPDHPRTLTVLNSLGLLELREGRLTEAERDVRDALAKRRAKLGDDHLETIFSLINLAWVLDEQKRFPEAEPLARDAVARSRKLFTDDGITTIMATTELGAILTDAERPAEAEPLLASAVAGARRTLLPTQAELGGALLRHGRCLTSLARYEEAEAALHEARSILTVAAPIDAPLIAASLTTLYGRWGIPPR